jgi:hypothetical protein
LAHIEKKFDAQFRVVFDAIRDLVTPQLKPLPGSASGEIRRDRFRIEPPR